MSLPIRPTNCPVSLGYAGDAEEFFDGLRPRFLPSRILSPTVARHSGKCVTEGGMSVFGLYCYMLAPPMPSETFQGQHYAVWVPEDEEETYPAFLLILSSSWEWWGRASIRV